MQESIIAGQQRRSTKGFCLTTLENLTKYWPGGSYLVMKSTPRVPGGRPLLDIGYKYNFRKVLGFIGTGGARITAPGNSYLSCFPDIYSNASIHPVIPNQTT